MTNKIAEWNFGDETLIQCCGWYPNGHSDVGDWEPDCSWNEDMDGKQATKELTDFMKNAPELEFISDERGIYGFYEKRFKEDGPHDYAILYCDCDDCTYEEYYGEKYPL